MRRGALLAALLGGCASAGGAIRFDLGIDPAHVVVRAPSAPDATLSLALLDGRNGTPGPAMLGRTETVDDEIRFVPSHPLVPGYRYRATLEAPGRAPLTADYLSPPPAPAPPAAVEAIYPTADRLPANLLKFYLHFSKPMRGGRELFDRIRLVRDDGAAVHDPWRHVELWSEDGRRLTLYIHPGRVKLGVNLREEFGPVLEAGRTYTLEIGAALQDESGAPLGRTWTKRFAAVDDDRARPSIEAWTLETPKAGTRGPLKAAFPEPLDRWLLDRYVKLLDGRGERVAGRAEVGPGERSWSFEPGAAWAAGDYTLEIAETFEDLAGNTPARLFEEDVSVPSAAPLPISRTVTVR